MQSTFHYPARQHQVFQSYILWRQFFFPVDQILTKTRNPFELRISKNKRATMICTQVIDAFEEELVPKFFAYPFHDVKVFLHGRFVDSEAFSKRSADSEADGF